MKIIYSEIAILPYLLINTRNGNRNINILNDHKLILINR